MSKEAPNAPALRFPEFDGEWEEVKVGEFSTFQRGFDLPSHDRREGNVPIVSSSGITGYHDTAQVERAGLVTGRYGSIGELYFIDKPHWPLNTALWVKDFHGNDIHFAFYQIKRINFQKLSDKTGVPGVNRNDLHAMKTAVPPLPEQQKVAAFLGAVDAKIALLARKRDLLETYKKGCMQQLFSQQIHFTRADGSPFPDWEETTLGELGHFTGGGTPDTNIAKYWRGETAWVSSSDIAEGKIKGLSINRRITSEAIKDSATQITPKGAILIITRVGLGKCAIAPEELCTSQDFTNFIPREGIGEFFAYWILQNQNKLHSLAQGTSIKGITTKDLKALNISIPHPDEQQKIAAFLTAIDSKIDLVGRQLDQARTFKKGLLQQMFV